MVQKKYVYFLTVSACECFEDIEEEDDLVWWACLTTLARRVMLIKVKITSSDKNLNMYISPNLDGISF